MNNCLKLWRHEADRLESLGDNCEFGFVNRKLGLENGSLFRWASMKPKCLLALLLNDFRHIYDFENLTPLRLAMVREDIYDIGWHTTLKSEHRGAALAFVHDIETRKKLFVTEQKKLAYLQAKFLCRIKAGGCIYFIKSNEGIEASILSAIHGELTRLAEGAPFWLVHVRLAEAEADVGSVRVIDKNRLEARVRRFASYSEADDVDLAVWEDILDNVFALARFDLWPASRRKSEQELARHFRFLPITPLQSDGASGVRFSVVSDHAWSRKLGENAFRLHCVGPDERNAVLLWSNIEVDRRSVVSLAARASVKESQVVRVRAAMKDWRGVTMHEVVEDVFAGRELTASFEIGSGERRPVSVEIRASTPRVLGHGERAVIDVDAPEIRFANF